MRSWLKTIFQFNAIEYVIYFPPVGTTAEGAKEEGWKLTIIRQLQTPVM